LRRLYEVAKGIDPDVFHGQCGSTFPASLTLKNLAPMLVTFHHSPKVELMMSLLSLRRGGSLGDIKIYGIGYPTYSLTYRSELKSTRISVAVSNSLRSELLDEMGWKYQEKLREIHNGVNLKQLDSEYGLVRDELHESANNVLFAGRFFWRKGAMEIIKIAHLMKRNNLNSKIIVHGDGPLFGKMKHTIEKLGLTNIDLRGFTTRFQLMQSLKRSKFVLIPSFYEACPIILLESMCLGKIPLMYSLPYSLEFTDHGKYGILAKGAEDLVNKFSNLNESDMESMSRATKNFARKKYDVRNTALQYIKLYKEICSE
jgi:glycosyltransferase involved in cell wall biosynthesis